MTDRELIAELIKRLEEKTVYAANVDEKRYVDIWDGWDDHMCFEFDEEGNFINDRE